ncbi:hypothetical protein VTP01DRAFT_3741 [Rhizomucor pusillus]|uniref:uncharacterized protein n=1 Tax=Rhizomucor pusillus TaxID=4840 RepID=UPI003742417E
MAGAENESPVSSPIRETASLKSSRDPSPQVESSPLRTVTNKIIVPKTADVKTPETKTTKLRRPALSETPKRHALSPSNIVQSRSIVETGRHSPTTSTSTCKTSPPPSQKLHFEPTSLKQKFNDTLLRGLEREIQDVRRQLDEKSKELKAARQKTATMRMQVAEKQKLAAAATKDEPLQKEIDKVRAEIEDCKEILDEAADIAKEQENLEKDIEEYTDKIVALLYQISEHKDMLGEKLDLEKESEKIFGKK